MDDAELEDTAYHAGRFNDVARETLKEAIAARGLDIQLADLYKRPRGVTLLALLVFLNAAFCLLVVILAFTRPELLSTALIARKRLSPEDWRLQIGYMAFFDSLAAGAFMVIGFGLWSLRNWARWVLLMMAGFALGRWAVGLVLVLIFAPRALGDALMTIRPIGLLINAAIFWCLVQPEVKRAFGEPAD